MYLAPCASSAFLIAASSVFQRSSWKFDHDTPTTISFAIAATDITLVDASRAAPNMRVLTGFIHFLLWWSSRTGLNRWIALRARSMLEGTIAVDALFFTSPRKRWRRG